MSFTIVVLSVFGDRMVPDTVFLELFWVVAFGPLMSKFKSHKPLVVSIIFYCCKTRTLLVDSEKQIQAFETKWLRKLLRISYFEHTTYRVQSKINFLVGPQEPHLATVKRRKFAWFGHVTSHDSLSRTVLRENLGMGWGGQCRGRQRKCRMDNVKEWTSLSMPEVRTMASRRKHWKRTAESSIMSPRGSKRTKDLTELWTKHSAALVQMATVCFHLCLVADCFW